MTAPILQNIALHVNLTPSEEALFLSHTHVEQVKAKTVLHHAGTVCRQSYFVNNGILRSFTINDNIVEHVLNIACTGWWISDMYSLIAQKPGELFIDVVDDAEIVILTKENQEFLYAEIPKLERFFRILVENSLVANQQRIMDNLSLTAEARFEKFCAKYPGLVAQLPQRMVASYIGVTPEFFSRMKAALLRRQ